MNLRQRTLLAVAVTLGCLLAGAYLIASHLVLRSFEDLEKAETIRTVDRVHDELNYQLRELHANSSDWSNWDDTYAFMADHNQRYIDSNLNNIQLNLDLMCFFDAQGRVFHSYEVHRPGHAKPPTAEELRKALRFDTSYGKQPSLNKDFCGFVTLPDGQVLLVSVRPILKTSGAGPARGWTAFALRLDAQELNELSERTHVRVNLYPLDGHGDKDCIRAAAQLENGAPYSQPLGERAVAGYTMLNDVYGRPAKILRVVDSRPIYAAGLATRAYLMQFTIVSGLVLGIVIVLVLEFAALSRVSRLSRQVEFIGSHVEGDGRISLPGRDELSWLAQKIDGLIENLRNGKIELAQKNADLESMVTQLAERNHVLANAVEGIAAFALDETISNCNGAFASAHALHPEDAAGTNWREMILPEDHDRVGKALKEMIAKGKARCEVRWQACDGSVSHEEITIVANYDAAGQYVGCHWFTRDITERKNLESRIQFQAFHDPLTGLPNRSLFVDRLRNACHRAARRPGGVAVLFIDLDGFKVINDTMGHEAGDHLLVGVAARIQHALRPHDTVARFGGDEFVVLADSLNQAEDAAIVAERVLEALEAPISLPTGKAFASASIGIVYTSDGDEDPDVLLHNADVAMYRAKENGHRASYMVFTPDMNAPAVERKELASALEAALAGDQLSLHYQPVIDLHNGRARGIEALLRWTDAERGDIPPNLFISVAEEAGLMDALGTWALRHACLQMKEWVDTLEGAAELTMHVNVSGRQLQRPDFIDTVAAALSESGLPPQRLRLEVAAKLLAVDPERTAAMLTELRSTGLKLALDDVGTGWYLISKAGPQPFDMVKIDGSVIWSMEADEDARSLVQATLIMAKSMKAEIAAEGIETLPQLNHLRDLGCRLGQGFIFGRPLPACDIAQMLESGTQFLSNEQQDSAA